MPFHPNTTSSKRTTTPKNYRVLNQNRNVNEDEERTHRLRLIRSLCWSAFRAPVAPSDGSSRGGSGSPRRSPLCPCRRRHLGAAPSCRLPRPAHRSHPQSCPPLQMKNTAEVPVRNEAVCGLFSRTFSLFHNTSCRDHTRDTERY